MRLSAGYFWATWLSLVGLIAGAAGMVFPTHVEVGETVMVLATAALFILTVNQIWPAPMGALAGRIWPAYAARNLSKFIPLPNVAVRLIDAVPNSHAAFFARKEPTIEKQMNWLGVWIKRRGIPVYGRRPPSTIIECIPADKLESGHIVDGATVLRGYDATDTYIDLQVRTDDLERYWADILRGVDG